jgi:hypothetical protein
LHSKNLPEIALEPAGLGAEPPEDLGPLEEGREPLDGRLGPLDELDLTTTVLSLVMTVFLSVSLTTVVSDFLVTLLDLEMNSFLDVDELKTGDFSEDSGVTGTSLWTQLHDECWNLSSLVQRAATLLLIALPQNEPVDEGPKT